MRRVEEVLLQSKLSMLLRLKYKIFIIKYESFVGKLWMKSLTI